MILSVYTIDGMLHNGNFFTSFSYFIPQRPSPSTTTHRTPRPFSKGQIYYTTTQKEITSQID